MSNKPSAAAMRAALAIPHASYSGAEANAQIIDAEFAELVGAARDFVTGVVDNEMWKELGGKRLTEALAKLEDDNRGSQ